MKRWLFGLIPVLAVVLLPATSEAQQEKRLKAPDFDGAVGWIGTDKPLRLQDLRGKFVVLDFWTLC